MEGCVTSFHYFILHGGAAVAQWIPRHRVGKKNARAWKHRAKLIALKKTVRAGPGPSPAKRVGQNA
ncbi:hypothetical protein D9M68_949120 [compost metagenome]